MVVYLLSKLLSSRMLPGTETHALGMIAAVIEVGCEILVVMMRFL